MLYGLDLFSGIGGISLALAEWVRPIAYCENDRYAQGVLLTRMADGTLPVAPIWDDVRTLTARHLPDGIEIIYGGFPCQDISVAGKREGITGSRSGLFSEIIRLADEIRPRYIFLENVPAIVNAGLDRVLAGLAEIRFDARWICLSAAEVGAWHRRERWWLLGHDEHDGLVAVAESGGIGSAIPDNTQRENETSELARANTSAVLANASSVGRWSTSTGYDLSPESSQLQHTNGKARADHAKAAYAGREIANGDGAGLERRNGAGVCECSGQRSFGASDSHAANAKASGLPMGQRGTVEPREWTAALERHGGWRTEPDVVRVVHGLQFRAHRIKALGNSVVPQCAREAFRILTSYA